jgi:hypothetical protein
VTVLYDGSSVLNDYPVRVDFDTQAWIAQGLLANDCSNLELRAGAGLLDLWISETECGQPDAKVWIAVPRLEAGVEVSIVACAQPTAALSNPTQVFSYFAGFDEARDWSVAQEDWIRHGNLVLEQTGDGYLRSPAGGTEHRVAIESTTALVRSGSSVLGIRFRGSASISDDFEIGAGTLTEVSSLWNGDRRGTWASTVHWDYLSGSMSSGGTRCFTQRADKYQVPDTWYEAELSYAGGDPNQFDLVADGDGGQAYSFSSSACAALPSQLPILIVFDHTDNGGNPSVEIDWMYVRERAGIEPTVTVR